MAITLGDEFPKTEARTGSHPTCECLGWQLFITFSMAVMVYGEVQDTTAQSTKLIHSLLCLAMVNSLALRMFNPLEDSGLTYLAGNSESFTLRRAPRRVAFFLYRSIVWAVHACGAVHFIVLEIFATLIIVIFATMLVADIAQNNTQSNILRHVWEFATTGQAIGAIHRFKDVTGLDLSELWTSFGRSYMARLALDVLLPFGCINCLFLTIYIGVHTYHVVLATGDDIARLDYDIEKGVDAIEGSRETTK
jgi:hypothetical protein